MNLDQRLEQAKHDWDRLHKGPRALVFVGSATCGLAAGARDLLEEIGPMLKRLKVKATVVPTGCIGMCFAEPLVDVQIPGQPRICYSHMDSKKLASVLKSHLGTGKPLRKYAMGTLGDEPFDGIPRLFDLPVLKSQVRIALRNCGIINPMDGGHYLARDGYQGLKRTLGMKPEEVIEEVVRSGLRGRGGGGFPTGLKWKFCRASQSSERYLICNADEGDPGAFMDRSVLEGDPHAVLEGMCIAAYAIGANHGYVYIRAEYPLAIQRLKTAIAQAREFGTLGENVLGSGFDFDIQIKEGAGAFVCGEETALMASIEGKRGMPRPRPPFPAVRGLFGQPSNINNVETLANVPNILRKGAAWFAGFGTEKSKGTKTFALTGKVNRTGLIEVPMGISLREIVYEIGGGIERNGQFKAAQTGGPSGGCIPASAMDTPVDYEHLTALGSIMGSGGLVVMDETTCMVDLARYFLTFTQNESCGKCVPCRLGTRQMLTILEDICAGRGKPDDIELLQRLGNTIKKGSLCGLGQTAPNPALTTIKYFREEYEEHIRRKHCRAAVCAGLVTSPCSHTCPAGIKAHRYVRAISQGRFEEAYLVVREKIPLPTVCGLVCFHPCETRCKRGGLDQPIAIRSLKRAAVEFGSRAEPRRPRKAPPSGRKVAVVGSGPAGLTAAYYLAKMGGHDVTIFEALPEVGGMLRVGIPSYRLPPRDLMHDVDIVRRVGVKIKTNHRITSVASLKKQGFDSVFLSPGAHKGMELRVEGHKRRGVLDCVDFLRQVSLGQKVPVGPRVMVVGGGNSAIDASRTARRLGGREVTIVYRRTRAEMPADPQEIIDALEEGVKLEILTLPVKVEKNHNGLNVTCQRMELGPVDRSGRPRPVPIEGSEFELQCDTILSAIGQKPDIPPRLGVDVTRWQTIRADDETGETSLKGVYAGGDAVTGPASVIEAIAHGRRAASQIDQYLGGTGDIEEQLAPPEDLDALPPMPAKSGDRFRPKLKHRAPSARVKGFHQVEQGYSRKSAIEEAKRCLRCDLED